MRATARIETVGRRKGIVVTELPYGVGTEKVVERIKTLVQGKSSRASPTSRTSPTATRGCGS